MKKTLLKSVVVAVLLCAGALNVAAQTAYGLATALWMDGDVLYSGIQTASVDLGSLNADEPTDLTLGDERIADYGILTAAGAGNKFYAFLRSDFDNDGIETITLNTVNFETGKMTTVNGEAYGNDDAHKPGYSMTGLTYDESTSALYGIESLYDEELGDTRTVLYKVDTETGELTNVKSYRGSFVGVAAKDGKLYMPKITITWEGKAPNMTLKSLFELYEIGTDYTMSEAPILSQEGVSGAAENNHMNFAPDGTLYLVMGTRIYAIDLDAKTVELKGQTSKNIFGLSFTKPTDGGEGGNVGGDDEKPSTRLLVRTTRYGDFMGTATGDMHKTEYYYKSDNKLSRVVELGRGYGELADTYSVMYLTKYNYNEKNQLTDTKQWQTGLYDFGDFAYALRTTVNYEYDENGRLLSEPDGYYTLYHEYDESGNIVKTTKKNASGAVVQVLEFSDFAGKNKPQRIESACPDHPEWTTYIYTATCTYDANGNKTEELRVRDGKNVQRETWLYEGTFLANYVNSTFNNAGEETPYSKTSYSMVDGNPNKIMHSDSIYFDDEWYASSPVYYIDEYVDFAGMSEIVAINDLKAEKVEDALNTVKLSFTAPMAANFGCAFNIYRKGELIATKSLGDEGLEIGPVEEGMPILAYTDSALYNGDYEYFVQATIKPYEEELDGDAPVAVGYNISNIAETVMDLDLPAVTNLTNAGQRQDENDVARVKIAWTNPEDREKYGFISNDLHFVNYQVADTVTVDPESTWLEGHFNGAGTSVFVLTRYKYGKAISDTLDVTLLPTGIETVATKTGATISFDGREVRLGDNADIAVYSAAGKLEAKAADANGISLERLNPGVYIVCVTKEGVTTAHKVVVR